MRKLKTGSREEYFSYLNENSKMDTSLMSFNLQAKFGLKKKEASNLVREWYFKEEKEKMECECEEKEDEKDEKEDKKVSERFNYEGNLDMNDDYIQLRRKLEILKSKKRRGQGGPGIDQEIAQTAEKLNNLSPNANNAGKI